MPEDSHVKTKTMEARKKVENICKFNPHLLELPEIKEIIKQWQRDVDKLIGESTEGYAAWLKRWLALWPQQKQTGLDYAVSGNSKTCDRKMRSFIKTFHGIHPNLADKKEWTPEKVMDAIYKCTEVYLSARKAANWEMTMKNSNFIQHMEKGSMLESYVVLFADGMLDKHIRKTANTFRI